MRDFKAPNEGLGGGGGGSLMARGVTVAMMHGGSACEHTCVHRHGSESGGCRAICAHTCTGIHSAHKGRPPFHPLLLRMECTDHAVPRECAPAALLLDLAPAWPRLQHACLPCMRRMHMCTNAIDVRTSAGEHACACICTRAINITRAHVHALTHAHTKYVQHAPKVLVDACKH